MSMSDPIADMLTRLRNALRVEHASVEMPASCIKENVCAVLKREGFIEDYALVDAGGQGMLRVALKYTPDRKPVIQGVRRVSKPSLRVYVKCADLRPVRSGLGIAIVSTSRGVLTNREARQAQVGGEVLCEVW